MEEGHTGVGARHTGVGAYDKDEDKDGGRGKGESTEFDAYKDGMEVRRVGLRSMKTDSAR